MITDGHLFNDAKRFGKEFKEVHETLDKLYGTPRFYSEQYHSLEFLLSMYNNGVWDIEQFRAGIFHLMDDFGNEIPVHNDWFNTNHWLGIHANKKLKEYELKIK